MPLRLEAAHVRARNFPNTLRPVTTAALAKTRFRGVSHQFASMVALVAGAVLVFFAPTARAAIAGGIYAGSLVSLFSVSALYHRRNWGPEGRHLMRRLDHGCIFVLIAGTYTPVCLLVLAPEVGRLVLAMVWSGALLGILQAVFWVHAPRALVAALYVGLGWSVMPWFGDVKNALGFAGIALLVTGGVLYSAGALIYALKRPNPIPDVFGFHEVFHALTIVASICHFTMVAMLVNA
jgi:hemolysin III